MNHPRPKARLSRALGIPLTRKCVRYFERRPYPPGVHGRSRRTTSDYQVRLLEKQRLRHQYNVSEAQLRRLFDEAARSAGKTGDTLVALLERRLDAVVLRAGLARSIYQARQLVGHGHVTVDGRKVDRPSYRLRPGQVVGVRERSRALPPFQLAAAGAHADAQPRPYLSVQQAELRATLLREPARHEVPVVCDEQLVVEFYSR
ncbi:MULTISPECIES: 30S ribosomal protein S4 [unclassified Micromonospora]|uniref:30S ribosomal protein S4 n=1 Tax=unclassified Micromonospora TaxID=2617518 RepID=UPI001B381477|nr:MULTISPECIES: 30S ribosomal protein S4 [unclassified Micromonospora]MBQ1045143.1 30S ribosomal protein S4 [Micromonospora sp. C72]MBQ1058476.1 30S ribosomal protein S4 [Micromonospora sp. C32]